MNKIVCFTGVSGVGKTTLLNFLKEEYKDKVETFELSGRPFLNASKGSYDEQIDDKLENIISFNSMMQISLKLINQSEKITILTRSPLDPIAYEKALKKSEYLIDMQREFINKVKDKIIWLYFPIEFPLIDKDDIKRGTNEEIRKVSDNFLIKELQTNDIDFYVISGSVETRKISLKNIFKKELGL